MVLLTKAQLFFCLQKTFLVQDVVDNTFVRSKSGFEFGFGQREDVLVGVEVDKASDGGVAESGGESEGYLRECFHCSSANWANLTNLFFKGAESAVGGRETAVPLVGGDPATGCDAFFLLGSDRLFLSSHRKPGGLLEVPATVEIEDVVGF